MGGVTNIVEIDWQLQLPGPSSSLEAIEVALTRQVGIELKRGMKLLTMRLFRVIDFIVICGFQRIRPKRNGCHEKITLNGCLNVPEQCYELHREGRQGSI